MSDNVGSRLDDDISCLTVALFSSEGIDPSIQYKYIISDNQVRLNFAIVDRVSITTAFRSCCIADTCIIVVHDDFEMFRSIIMMIDNATSVKNVLLLVDSMQSDKYLKEFGKLIGRELNIKCISTQISYKSIFKDEKSNSMNEILEWVKSLSPNMNYEHLKNKPPCCSIVQWTDHYYGLELLVKVESGFLTHSSEIEINSSTNLKMTRGYRVHGRIETKWKNIYAGQFVAIDIESLRKIGREARILRGSMLGNYFDKSKGSSVTLDSFWIEFTNCNDTTNKFQKGKEFKIYCGQRELICSTLQIIPLRKSHLVQFRPIIDIIYNRKVWMQKNEILKQPTFLTTFEKCSTQGLCMIKQKNVIDYLGKIMKVIYRSDTRSLWIESSIPLFTNFQLRKYENWCGFSDISIKLV